MFEIIATCLAVYLLLAVAFPERLLPRLPSKKKKLGSSYWGVYEGVKTEELSEGIIEAPDPGRAGRRVIAGSTMYAQGRGVSMKR